MTYKSDFLRNSFNVCVIEQCSCFASALICSCAHAKAYEVTRLLFIMHKFHIELNHHSQIENAIYNLHKKQTSAHTTNTHGHYSKKLFDTPATIWSSAIFDVYLGGSILLCASARYGFALVLHSFRTKRRTNSNNTRHNAVKRVRAGRNM